MCQQLHLPRGVQTTASTAIFLVEHVTVYHRCHLQNIDTGFWWPFCA
jgi:hypothetical protein